MSRMTWDELRQAAGPGTSTAYEWMWQDLDGLHLADLPEHAPLTSILWGWPRESGTDLTALYRVRLDGETVYAAQPHDATLLDVLPWAGLDQVAQARGADGLTRTEIRELRLTEVRETPPPDGSVPLTFYARSGKIGPRGDAARPGWTPGGSEGVPGASSSNVDGHPPGEGVR